MIRQEVLDKITDILCDVFDEDLDITDETVASDVDGCDSLAQITILTLIQQEFSVSFAISDTKRFKNVGELVDLIIERMK